MKCIWQGEAVAGFLYCLGQLRICHSHTLRGALWSNAPAIGSALTCSEFSWPFIKRMLLTTLIPQGECENRMAEYQKGHSWTHFKVALMTLVIRLPAASKYTNKYLNSWSELVSLSHEHLFRCRNSLMHYRVHVGGVVSGQGGKVCTVRICSADARRTVGFVPPTCHSYSQKMKEKSAFLTTSKISLKCVLSCYNSSL